MELIKKISVLLFIISLSLCTTEEKAKAKNPLGKFEGTWRTIDETDPTKEQTIVFNDQGECSLSDDDSTLKLTPLEEFKFTDKPDYIAYIYNITITMTNSSGVSESKTAYIIIWYNGEIMRTSKDLVEEEDLDELKKSVESMESTNKDIQVEFAKKES